jgi:hypothetical protein
MCFDEAGWNEFDLEQGKLLFSVLMRLAGMNLICRS